MKKRIIPQPKEVNGCRIGLFDCQYEYGWKLV